MILIGVSRGEYNHHKIYLSSDTFNWTAENPVVFMKDLPGCPIYMFSEEKSMFHDQPLNILEQCLPQFTITDFLELGIGYTHTWEFWSDPPVQKEIRNILIKKFLK